MNIPMSWLNEYIDLKYVDINAYMDKMTMIGQKVEGVEFVSNELTGIVTGKILKVEEHPNADKLKVTKVDVNTGAPLSVITGADNIYENAIVPIALDGAVLSGGKQINNGLIRGVVSEGMMCSVEELGFNRHDFPEAPEHGIYIFPDESTPLGADVCRLLELRQSVIEYEITSNRPDCFSIVGIAREASAAFGVPFKMPDTSVKQTAGGDAGSMLTVKIENSALCPRYIGRIIKNVKIAPSPLWMRRRLTSAGIRPINNIVDVTNYVMLEMGQPMHAFDLDVVEGGIIVRTAKDGETFNTLDGLERTLDGSMLVIADHVKTIGIAGVMGGENSKITGAADAVLLESACFDGTNIRLTAKKLGLRTDASSKYEKGLDPNLAELAVNRAANLIELLNAGEIVRGMVDCYPERRETREIPFEAEKISALLGVSISPEKMAELLKPLEIEISGEKAIIPTFRPDLEITADLAEEVARTYGYDVIDPQMIEGQGVVGKKSYKQSLLDDIRNTMVSFGFYEGITFSFEGPDVFDKLLLPKDSELRKAIPIMNPLGESYSLMRTTVMNSMLNSLSINYNKRNSDACLFEIANVYAPKQLPLTELPTEKPVLIAGFYGQSADFYEAKGYAEALLNKLGIKGITFKPAADAQWLHPGRSADIYINNENAGFAGEVHPACLEHYSIGKRAYVFQLSLDKLYDNANTDIKFKELPKYPPVQRDISLLASDGVMVAELESCIIKNGGPLLCDVILFDVYKGEQMGEGVKSVAYSLIFRSQEKTLTEGDVTPLMKKIVAGLKKECGAELRS